MQEQEHVRELDDLVFAELHRGPTERIHPELLVLGDAGHVEVIVADDDRRFLVQELRRRPRRGDGRGRNQHEDSTGSIHGAAYYVHSGTIGTRRRSTSGRSNPKCLSSSVRSACRSAN